MARVVPRDGDSLKVKSPPLLGGVFLYCCRGHRQGILEGCTFTYKTSDWCPNRDFHYSLVMSVLLLCRHNSSKSQTMKSFCGFVSPCAGSNTEERVKCTCRNMYPAGLHFCSVLWVGAKNNFFLIGCAVHLFLTLIQCLISSLVRADEIFFFFSRLVKTSVWII